MSDELVACIVEGGAERAVIDLLLDNHLLIFEREQLLDDALLLDKTARRADVFEKRYLGRHYSKPIVVYRILDNPKSDRFKLSPFGVNTVKVVNVDTSPEIEMLVIHAEHAYESWMKARVKPSVYCKDHLHMRHVKEYEFIQEYFSDIDKLLYALEEYKRCSKPRKDELTIWDLVK